MEAFTEKEIGGDDTKWNEYYDIILANPPFFSPKGGIKPHNKFSIKSKKAEVYVTDNGYGCRYYEDHMWKKDIVYKNHSESYAESAAENYVLGILEL